MISGFRGQYFFLSNFFPCEVEYEGIVYPSAEHAFQAAKCANPSDKVHIQGLSSPKEAKALGRRCKIIPNWNAIRNQVMLDIVRAKFQDSTLASKLLQTAPKELVEDNNWGDIYWGCVRGRGSNHLGLILMQVRDELLLAELLP